VSNSQKLTGLIINLFNAKEADKVIHILIQNGSKVAMLAKGVKKSTSKKSHAIDLLNLIEAKAEKGVQLSLLTDTKLINSFSGLKQDYLGLCFTQSVCEILNSVAQEEVEDPLIWQTILSILEKAETTNLHFALSILYLKSLQILGLMPDLSLDPETGDQVVSDHPIGFVIPFGFTNQPTENEQQVSVGVYKAIRFMALADTSKCFQLDLDESQQKEMFKILHIWATNLLEKRLPAGEMLR